MTGLFLLRAPLTSGPVWCWRAHHPKRACVEAGQRGPYWTSFHLRPHPGWRFAGTMRSGWSCPDLVITCIVDLKHHVVCTDTFDLWQRIHRGCRDETGGSAGGRESPFRCRKGIYIVTLTLTIIHFIWTPNKRVVSEAVEEERYLNWIFVLSGRAAEAGSHHLSRRWFPGCLAHCKLTDGGRRWSGGTS